MSRICDACYREPQSGELLIGGKTYKARIVCSVVGGLIPVAVSALAFKLDSLSVTPLLLNILAILNAVVATPAHLLAGHGQLALLLQKIIGAFCGFLVGYFLDSRTNRNVTPGSH